MLNVVDGAGRVRVLTKIFLNIVSKAKIKWQQGAVALRFRLVLRGTIHNYAIFIGHCCAQSIHQQIQTT